MERLIAAIRAKHNPTVAGLDPRLDMLPAELLDKHLSAKGETLQAAADAIVEFNVGILDALADVVPAVKPQLACYEAFGAPGMDAFAQTIAHARQLGYYIIADAKRGDIGSTAEQYAQAFLGTTQVGSTAISPFPCDCVTVNPYLGSDNLLPFYQQCQQHDKDIFVLVKTSNKSSYEVQELMVGDRPVYKVIAELLARTGADSIGASGYSRIGMVVGATYPAHLTALRKALPNSFFLVPGYGSQGGTAADVAGAFDHNGYGAIINSSRAILCAWQKRGGHFADAARAEALDMKKALSAVISMA